MSSIGPRVGEDLHEVADLDLTDLEIEEAWLQFRARLAADAARRRRAGRRSSAAAAALLVAVGVAWLLPDSGPGPQPTRPAPTSTSVPEVTCLRPGQRPQVAELPGHPQNIVEQGPDRGPEAAGSTCHLVLAFSADPSGGGPRESVWIYSDGRVITSGTSPGSFSNYLEQRLTPAGVEQVRSDAVALLGTPVSATDDRGTDGWERVVRYGRQTVSVRDQAAFARRLLDLSWLPERAWRTREARAFVPQWNVTCYGGRGGKVGTARVLSLLPRAAEAVLRAKTPTQRSTQPGDSCAVLTAREKNVVVEALDDSWPLFARGENPRRYVIGTAGGLQVSVSFEVVLPHGGSGLSAD